MGPDGLCLAIEVSNPSAYIEHHGTAALGRMCDGVLAEELSIRRLSDSHRQDVTLMAEIDALVREAGVVPADVEAVVVSTGPGGYTSVRVGVAAASTMAASLNVGCAGVPTASVAVAGARALGVVREDEPIGVALASKGDGAWYAMAAGGSIRTEPVGMCDAVSVVGVMRQAESSVRTVLADDHLPALHRAAFDQAGWRVEPVVLDAMMCLRAAGGVELVDAAQVVPMYPREPEAVRLWRGRG